MIKKITKASNEKLIPDNAGHKECRSAIK